MPPLGNDPVEIAQAALDAAQHPIERTGKFLELIESKQPNSETLAKALAYASAHYSGPVSDKVNVMLESQLQLRLTLEHVSAQEKMANSAGFLTAASVFLAIVTLIGSCAGIA